MNPKADVARPAGHDDMVAIVTGGSKGIGSGCAKVFVEAGASVVVCDLDSINGERVATELTAQGPGKCLFEKCDVRKPDEIKRVIETALKEFGHPNCLINNAGV